MEQIVKILESHYSHQFEEHNVLKEYFDGLFKKPEYLELFSEYSVKRLRQKELDSNFIFILKNFVAQCPEHVFEKCGNNWIQLLIRNGSEDVQILSSVFVVISEIIDSIARTSFKKELDSKTIEKSLNFCIDYSTESCLFESLECIETILTSYPEHCSFIWQTVYKHLMQLIDVKNETVVTQIGQCLFQLYQVKGSLTKGGGNLENSWFQFQNQIMGSLFQTINLIIEEDSFIDLKLKDFKLDFDSSLEKKPVLCQRFLNLLNFLRTALTEPSPVPKPIHVGKLTDFICRLLEGNGILIGNKSFEKDVTIGPFIPEIHLSLLETLRCLIIVTGSNALLFGKSICNILYLVLKRSSENNSYRKQKTLIYDTIMEWTTSAGSGSFAMNMLEKTIQEIALDMEKFQADVDTKRKSKHFRLPSNKSSKKRKRNTTEVVSIEVTNNCIRENAIILSKGLNCLKTILQIGGHLLSAPVHHLLLRSLHIFAKKLVESSMWDLDLLTDDYDLHKDICEVLIIFNKSSHHLHRSSINFSLELLSLIKSCSPHNRELCQRFSNDLETIFHFPRSSFQVLNPTSALMEEVVLTKEFPSKTLPDDHNIDSDEEEDTPVSKQPKIVEIVDCDESQITSTVISIPDKIIEIQSDMEITTVTESVENEMAINQTETETVDTISSEEEDEVIDIDSNEDVTEIVEKTAPVEDDGKKETHSTPITEESVNIVESVHDLISDFVDELL